MKELSIIIVNYNVKDFLEDCIKSCLLATKNIDAEVIVVDNNSQDGSKEFITNHFSQILWIQNSENLGFSKANNIGVNHSSGKYIVLLNPDTQVDTDIFEKIIPFAENIKNFGALGVRIADFNNCYRPESKRNIPNLKNTFTKLFTQLFFLKSRLNFSGLYNTDLGEYEIGKVEILTGCFFFTKRKTYNEVGGLDESYFMYGEDIDLSYSILMLGYDNYYYGQSTLLHYKGAATHKDKISYKRFYNAMEIFVKKYHRKPYLFYILLLFGVKIRYYLALVLFRFEKN